MKLINKLWGHEEILVNNKLYCLKRLYLKKGYQCSLHCHKIKDETFVIEKGIMELEIYLNDIRVIQVLKKGSKWRIEPYEKHRFRSLTRKCIFLEVSTHDDPKDSYRIEKSKKI